MSELSRIGRLGLAVGWLCGCAQSSPIGQLHIEIDTAGADTRLTLLTSPGLELNARLKPALELPDGKVVRFDSPALTPDSAYFAGAPSTLIPGHHAEVHGTLRASVCNTGALVCRSVVIRI